MFRVFGFQTAQKQNAECCLNDAFKDHSINVSSRYHSVFCFSFFVARSSWCDHFQRGAFLFVQQRLIYNTLMWEQHTEQRTEQRSPARHVALVMMTTTLRNLHGLQTRLSDPRRTSQAVRETHTQTVRRWVCSSLIVQPRLCLKL